MTLPITLPLFAGFARCAANVTISIGVTEVNPTNKEPTRNQPTFEANDSPSSAIIEQNNIVMIRERCSLISPNGTKKTNPIA